MLKESKWGAGGGEGTSRGQEAFQNGNPGRRDGGMECLSQALKGQEDLGWQA